MDYHHHARLTIHSREQLAKRVLAGELSLNSAAAEFKLSRQSAAKWVRRFREGGSAALRDLSSRPHRSPRSISAEQVTRIEQLRRQRWTGVHIAQTTGLSRGHRQPHADPSETQYCEFAGAHRSHRSL